MNSSQNISTRTIALFEAAEDRLRDALDNFDLWCVEASEAGVDVLPTIERMRDLSESVLNG